MILKANNTSFPFCSPHHSPISVFIFEDSPLLALFCGQAHTSVTFAHFSSSHSACSHHTLNIHTRESLSFSRISLSKPLAFLCQTRHKIFTSMYMLPSHLEAFSSYTALSHTPLLSLSSLLFSKYSSLCPQTLWSSQLCFLTCCTSLIPLLFLCLTFLRGCSFFYTALSLAQLFVLPTVWEAKPKCPTAICATWPPQPFFFLPHWALL